MEKFLPAADLMHSNESIKERRIQCNKTRHNFLKKHHNKSLIIWFNIIVDDERISKTTLSLEDEYLHLSRTCPMNQPFIIQIHYQFNDWAMANNYN